MSWNAPGTDGWHWLRWHTNSRLFYVAHWSALSRRWVVFSGIGVEGLDYAPEDIARLYTYIGPIEEPKP